MNVPEGMEMHGPLSLEDVVRILSEEYEYHTAMGDSLVLEPEGDRSRIIRAFSSITSVNQTEEPLETRKIQVGLDDDNSIVVNARSGRFTYYGNERKRLIDEAYLSHGVDR